VPYDECHECPSVWRSLACGTLCEQGVPLFMGVRAAIPVRAWSDTPGHFTSMPVRALRKGGLGSLVIGSLLIF